VSFLHVSNDWNHNEFIILRKLNQLMYCSNLESFAKVCSESFLELLFGKVPLSQKYGALLNICCCKKMGSFVGWFSFVLDSSQNVECANFLSLTSSLTEKWYVKVSTPIIVHKSISIYTNIFCFLLLISNYWKKLQICLTSKVKASKLYEMLIGRIIIKNGEFWHNHSTCACYLCKCAMLWAKFKNKLAIINLILIGNSVGEFTFTRNIWCWRISPCYVHNVFFKQR